MRKNINIIDAALLQGRLQSGRRVQGALYMDECTGEIIFKAYNRHARIRPKDKLVYRLEHGWVKESKQRLKVFESVPKDLGMERLMGVMEREFGEAVDVLIDRELDSLDFC